MEYKKSNIYTKTGDKGETSLYNGERLSKDSLFFDAVGTLDEISSVIGMYYIETDHLHEKNEDLMYEINSMLKWVQSRLLDLGSHIATPINRTNSNKKLEQTKFEEHNVTNLEKWIDKYDSQLPKLKNFILPKGSLHLARCVCRRAERSMIELYKQGSISEDAIKFINRLSDFLFVIARFVSAFIFSQDEIIYIKNNDKII